MTRIRASGNCALICRVAVRPSMPGITTSMMVQSGSSVARFATELPDWTIMDVVMPGMDGLTATRQIKAQFPEARILVMTQHHNLKLRDSAHAAGAIRFLEKDQLVRLES